MPSYSNFYSETNADLIKTLELILHPEGGYYKETDRQTVQIPSPFADGKPRSLATSIYYLLTYEERAGKIHMNKSLTYHVLHQGRAEYTLITPSPNGPDSPPKIEKKVMGTDIAAGETRLLIVGGGVWKMSEIPEKDIDSAKSAEKRERTGCLITEVVTPGFHWEDHRFLTKESLVELFRGDHEREERIREFSGCVKE